MSRLIAMLVGWQWTWLLLGTFAAALACGENENDAATGGTSSQAGATASGGATTSGGATASGGSGAVSEPGVLYIQEDELGFSGVDGKVLPREGSTSITGYTGKGFADSDSGYGKTIGWSVNVETAGSYTLGIRYAFGGTASNLRDAKLLVNGTTAVESVAFAYTGTWSDWQESEPIAVEFAAGPHVIQLQALNESGLANIDYLKIVGEGVTGTTPSFSLTVDQNDPLGGNVSFEPNKTFYAADEVITVSAVANPGYFFQSWSGNVSSANADFSFSISENTHVTALFLPIGTEADPDLIGYAAVQDDQGTPYVLTGGSLGEAVTATTFGELKSYLESPEPYVVSFSGLFAGADEIKIASDKTLLGVGDSAHLQGIELEINGSRNVIIRNVAVSHVIADGASAANDAIVITGGAKNVWIDHCELFSDLDHGKDYYDGLLEIKNAASFVTVSWTVFRHHFKASLISSGDEQVGDTVIRATYHHNYFHDLGSRMPSIRFGLAHVFGNYYLNNLGGSGVNSRMGAVVKVEHNYFENSDDPIGYWDSPMTGYWDVNNNHFEACRGSQPATSTAMLPIPYDYTLDPVADIPALVVANAGVGKL